MFKKLTRVTPLAALVAVTAFADGASAGGEPYIATVCDDSGRFSEVCPQGLLGVRTSCVIGREGAEPDCQAPPRVGEDVLIAIPSALEDFYLSVKEYQFTHTNTERAYVPELGIPTFASGETFRASAPINQEDPCDITADAAFPGQNAAVDYVNNLSARVPYKNAGSYEWTVVLPRTPESNLNIAIQCAVLKPQETDITYCAAEEGEFQGPGRCNQGLLDAGQPTVNSVLLPRVTATAYPGFYSRSFNSWPPFNLTAYSVPSPIALTPDAGDPLRLANSLSMQVLNGGITARIPLKACLTETIYVKQPVAGQFNALGQQEYDLEAGDYIVVRMDVQRGHPMDVYCHAQSLRVQGMGDPLSLLD